MGKKREPKKKGAGGKAPADAGPAKPAEATHLALWIRLDIPYEEGARFMRGVLGFRPAGNPNAPVGTLAADNCENIPSTVDRLLCDAAAKGVTWDSTTMLIFPLDDRHMLAHYVLEESQKRGFRFERSVPEEMKPAAEPGICGSADGPAMTREEARTKINELNAGAREECMTNDMPAGMRMLRQALEIGVRILGWAHSDTAFTLRNLVQVLRATGNEDNESDGRHLLKQMALGLKEEKLDVKDSDPELITCLEYLARECVALDDPDTADEFMRLKERASA